MICAQHLWVVTIPKKCACPTCQYSKAYMHFLVSLISGYFLTLFLGMFSSRRICTAVLVYLLKWYNISEGNSGPFLYFLIKTSPQYIWANTHFDLHLNDKKTKRLFQLAPYFIGSHLKFCVNITLQLPFHLGIDAT